MDAKEPTPTTSSKAMGCSLVLLQLVSAFPFIGSAIILILLIFGSVLFFGPICNNVFKQPWCANPPKDFSAEADFRKFPNIVASYAILVTQPKDEVLPPVSGVEDLSPKAVLFNLYSAIFPGGNYSNPQKIKTYLELTFNMLKDDQQRNNLLMTVDKYYDEEIENYQTMSGAQHITATYKRDKYSVDKWITSYMASNGFNSETDNSLMAERLFKDLNAKGLPLRQVCTLKAILDGHFTQQDVIKLCP